MGRPLIDHTGQNFGRWIVLGFSHMNGRKRSIATSALALAWR